MQASSNHYYPTETPFTWRRIALPLGVLGIVVLGGATHIAVEGLVLCCIGLWLFMRTPERTLGRWLDWTVLALLGLALIQFLPLAKVLPRAGWWQQASDMGIPLPSTLTVQPWVSMQGFPLLIAGLCFFYLCINHPMSHTKRMHWLWTFAIGGSLLSIGILIGNAYDVRWPFAKGASIFTYFPNRNQTSNVLCLCGITAFGLFIDSLKMHRHRWVVIGLTASVITFFGIVYVLSRASLILFFVGILLWLILSHQQTSRLITSKYIIPTALLFFSLFLMVSGDNLQRFESLFSLDASVENSFRSLIFRDTLTLIHDQPLSGVGIRNFQYVIPQYRDASSIYGAILHPENDWLWVCSEMGLVFTLVLAGAVLYMVVRITQPNFKHHVSYRAISTICVLIFLLHTLCDVPGHRFGTVFVVLIFLTLSVSHSQEHTPTMIPRIAFRTLGAICLIFGLTSIASGVFKQPLHVHTYIKATQKASLAAARQGDFNAVNDHIEAGTHITPLDAWWYFQHAQSQLRLNHTPSLAKRNFERARFLNPLNIYYPLYEGLLWLPYSPDLTFAAWQSALRNHSFKPETSWQFIVCNTPDKPEYYPYLQNLSRTDQGFRIFFLKHLGGERFAQEIQYELQLDPTLQSFEAGDLRYLLLQWAKGPKAEDLLKWIEQHPTITPNSWLYQALALAQLKRYEAAVSLTFQNLTAPTWPEAKIGRINTLEEIEVRYSLNADDIIAGSTLLQAQVQSQQIDLALKTVRRLEKASQPPRITQYWKGYLLQQTGDFKGSWEALHQYIQLLKL